VEDTIGAVVLFGSPGAGKGTQARGLGERLRIPNISTGDMIRTQAADDTPLGRDERVIMEKGELIPDEWVNQLVVERLRQPDCRRGFVLDGYPRTRGQAQALEAMLASNGTRITLFKLDIEYNEVIRRIAGRRMCPRCGTNYNVYLQPPKKANVCDRDQEPLVIRPDDREEVLRERLSAYEKQTRPLVEYFREKGMTIHDLDASQPAQEISERLLSILGRQ